MDSINKEKTDFSGNSTKFSTFSPKIWTPHPSTVSPFLLVDSCRKNKIRTKEPEILFFFSSY